MRALLRGSPGGPDRRRRTDLRDESGVTLIEVLVSALLVVAIAAGAFTAIDAAGRTSSEERHRLQAHSIAEADQARMRSLKLSELANLRQTRTVTQDGTAYTVTSRGDFVSNTTQAASCANPSADYIRITSTISWPSRGSRPPVVLASIVTPPSGSLSTARGALAITVLDSTGTGIQGVGVSGSGAGTFSGSTDENGCALFGNLPQGNYTLSTSGIASGLVDRDGNPPGSSTTSVIGGSTNQVTLQFAQPGSATISFNYRRDNNTIATTQARSIVATNTGMTAPKAFSAPGGNPANSITASPLFPFSSAISFFAGACANNNPNPTGSATAPGAAAMVSRTVPPGGTTTGTVQLPALHVSVVYGGSPLPGARVFVNDDTCGGSQLMFQGTTDSNGRTWNIPLPWGRYNLCADYGGVRKRVPDIDVKTLTSTGTRVTIDGGSGTQSGTCP